MRTDAKWPRAEGLRACEKKSFEVAFEAIYNDGEYLIGRGVSFHIWGEAEEKARQPIFGKDIDKSLVSFL